MLDEITAHEILDTSLNTNWDNKHQLDERLAEAVQFIERNYSQSSLPLKLVSRSAGLSMWHFSRLFNLQLGMTLREYLKAVRLRHACRLLSASNLTIKEIAAEVGYIHLSDFYHHFKKEYNTSPLLFRRHVKRARHHMNSAVHDCLATSNTVAVF